MNTGKITTSGSRNSRPRRTSRPVSPTRLLASENTTPPEMLMELSRNPDLYTRIRCASNKSTPVEALNILATDETFEVRRCVAENGNSTAETLSALFSTPIQDAATALAEDSYVIENLHQMLYGKYVSFIIYNLNDEEISEEYYYVSARVLVEMVANHPNASPELLNSLMRSKDNNVRSAFGYLETTPLNILKEYTTDKNEDVRTSVLFNISTPVKLRDSLVGDVSARVRRAVAIRTGTASILNILSKDVDDTVKSAVAKNDYTQEVTLTEMLNDADTYTRRQIALHDNTSVEVLRKLASDAAWMVRYGVASNKNSPMDVRSLVLADGVEKFAMSSEKNSTLNLMISEHHRYEECSAASGDCRCHSDKHEFTDEEMNRYDDWGLLLIQLALLNYGATTPEMLIQFMSSNNYLVRQFLAAHPDATAEMLVELLDDYDEVTRICAMRNPNVPQAILVELAKDPQNIQALAHNPNTPTETLVRWATHSDYRVRVGVQDNPNTPKGVSDMIRNSIKECGAEDSIF